MSETEEIVDQVEDTHSRLGQAVAAVAYKASHAGADAKEAVTSKKDAILGSVRRSDGAKGKVVEKIAGMVGHAKDVAADKVADARELVAERLPGGNGKGVQAPPERLDTSGTVYLIRVDDDGRPLPDAEGSREILRQTG